MRTRDLLLAGLSSLRRQKLRTTLTVLGVTIGIATLVASVSVGVGVRRIIEDGFKKERRLREITVYAGHERTSDQFAGVPSDILRVEGEMSDVRKERIRQRLARDWRQRHAPPAARPLTPARVQEFTTWEHVISAEPDLSAVARVNLGGQLVQGEITGYVGKADRLTKMLTFGRRPHDDANEVVVHEFLLYQLGVRSDADVQAALGQTIRVEFSGNSSKRPEVLLMLFDADQSRFSEDELRALARAKELLPQAIERMDLPDEEKAALLRALGRKRKKDPTEKVYLPLTAEFQIVGVFRDADRDADGDIAELFTTGLRGDLVLPQGKAERLFAATPGRTDRGFDRVVITVDADENLKSVSNRLKAEGFNSYAVGLFLQTARKNVLLIGFTMDFVALLALSVACLGIMNTMFTAVLERVREIGVMKAVGAKDRHILIMFLVEGAMIGLLGGWLGVLVGWVVSFPGDNVALRLIREQEPNMPQPETVFRYPLWLVFGAPALALVVTTLAGLLPARRAARVEPVVALRTE